MRKWFIAGIVTALIFSPVLLLLSADMRRAEHDQIVQENWSNRTIDRVSLIGTTERLEIMPLVNWHAESDVYRTEPGVSYLVKTDQSTILFDLGLNHALAVPSPLEHNMLALNVDIDGIDTVFLSHAHRDHVGGVEWERIGSFALGRNQGALSDKRIIVPTTLKYPGARVETMIEPAKISQGIATTGAIRRQLFVGPVDEQALIVNVAGKGLVVIVGCGHQTLPKLITRIEETFDEPIYGIVGDLHYPIPEGRLFVRGIDAQRRLASGNGLFAPIKIEDVEEDIQMLKDRNVQLIALGGHDTSDQVLNLFSERFPGRFQNAKVGRQILVQ